jgi:hypothetical protein
MSGSAFFPEGEEVLVRRSNVKTCEAAHFDENQSVKPVISNPDFCYNPLFLTSGLGVRPC